MADIDSPTSPAIPGFTLSLYNLTGIVLLVAFVALGAAYVIESISQKPREVSLSAYNPPFVSKNIAGTSLSIPADWFQGSGQLGGSFADQVNLGLRLDFGGGTSHAIGILLTPHSRAQSSAYLLDKVYLHQFMATQLSGPPGLIGKPLKALDGFQNETVWYDPLSPMPFVAKCQAPPLTSITADCMRTVRLTDGLSVTYSFSDDVLSLWPRFDEVMRPYLESMGAVRPI